MARSGHFRLFSAGPPGPTPNSRTANHCCRCILWAGSSRSSWSVSVIECGQYDRREAVRKRPGRDFPRRTQGLGQGAGNIPPASVGPSPAAGRHMLEGSSAMPEAELTGSLDRSENRISFHLILHRKSSSSLPLAVGGDWSPSVARRAGSCYI